MSDPRSRDPEDPPQKSAEEAGSRGWHGGEYRRRWMSEPGRSRPPWWPDGMAWPPPPDARPPWAMNRGRFMRRIGLFVLAVLVLVVAVITALSVFIASLFHAAHPGPAIVVLAVAAAVTMLVLGRGVRRAALPIGNLIEAAGRVETGDYAARVPERGPSDMRGLARAFNTMTARLGADAEQRQRLLADVSHELRNPLAVIQGNLEGVLDGVYPADAEHLSPILDETRVLARLIDDLRTLSLAEAGELPLHPEPTDIGALLGDLVASYRPQASAGAVALTLTAPEQLPTIELDPARTREIVANLLSNALRHTPSGGNVGVGVERAAGAPFVTVTVSDTGGGMARDALDRIFDRFYRSSDSPGSGLGLPIAQQLVEAQGGAISAESEPGRGTTIRFTLPIGT